MADSCVSVAAKRKEGSNGGGRDSAASEVSSTSSSPLQQKKRKYEDLSAVGGAGMAVDSSTSSADGDQDAPKTIRPSFGIARVNSTLSKSPASAISIKFGAQKPKEPQPTLKKTSVASVFNADDEDDEEEMPPEAKMRMRNLGRETPTSTGPNSFGKTKSGFCDTRKVFDKNEPGPAKGSISSKETKKS